MKFKDMTTEGKILRVLNEIILWALVSLVIFWGLKLMLYIFDIIILKWHLL